MSLSSTSIHLSSFSTHRLNTTTFLIIEKDSYDEWPFIYAKLHPTAPLLILTDTGCNSPAPELAKSRYTHLREYLEYCPLSYNAKQPLNPAGSRAYVIISTHCHYDHTLGIPQFLPEAQIISSAYGKDFIESDLAQHGLFAEMHIAIPEYTVTKWAQAFEDLSIRYNDKDFGLGLTSILTPGHTPDSLSYYDREEHWLFVGDLLYEEGFPKGAAILFPPHGNIIEWVYSLQKLLRFVESENERLAASDQEHLHDEREQDGWVVVSRGRVKLAAGHITAAGDAQALLTAALRFMHDVFEGKIPVIREQQHFGEKYQTWRQDGRGMFLSAPVRLIDAARKLFLSR